MKVNSFSVQLNEGLYDPGIFKAFFLAGGPGSGKSWVSERTLSGMGLKVINSDNSFSRALEKEKMSLNMATQDAKEIARRDEIRAKAKVSSTFSFNFFQSYVPFVSFFSAITAKAYYCICSKL